ncbi:hypothetical protein IU485_28145 [Nocardia cyriacigeorgica]|uniref:hypothetical protein n=1 Tax=Nocardia cyriacigeorgica TaxID=135487 RepID=UPI0018942F76|nr:hypothetical protein [Nocardia cyriacigeorgica]MBF6085244.1 hypothetical protein [Nocardia cyriacigeorgica]
MSILAPLRTSAAKDPFGLGFDLEALNTAAENRVSQQNVAAITGALSDAEILAERKVAQTLRALDRDARLAEGKADHSDNRWHRKALAAQQRVTSPAAAITDTFRTGTLVSRGLIGVMAAGVLWGAVNVQQNFMGDTALTDPRYWLAFLIEPMVTLPLVFVMITATTAARRGRPVDRRRIALVEGGLLLLTLGLNVGPHLGTPGEILWYSIAPVMIAASVLLHSWATTVFADLIVHAPVETPAATAPVVALTPAA